MIDYDDLPDVVRVTRARNDQREELERKSGLKIQEYWVLKELGEVYADAAGLGRQALVARCMAHGNAVSEHITCENNKDFEAAKDKSSCLIMQFMLIIHS